MDPTQSQNHVQHCPTRSNSGIDWIQGPCVQSGPKRQACDSTYLIFVFSPVLVGGPSFGYAMLTDGIDLGVGERGEIEVTAK